MYTVSRQSLLNLAIYATGEEVPRHGVAVEVSNLQHLGWSTREGNGIGINRGQDVVPSGGIEDTLVVSHTAGVKAVAGC